METFEKIWPVILMVLGALIPLLMRKFPSLRKSREVAGYIDDVVGLFVLEEEEVNGNAEGRVKHTNVKNKAVQRLQAVRGLAERTQNRPLGKIVDTSIKAAVGRRKIIEGPDPLVPTLPPPPMPGNEHEPS